LASKLEKGRFVFDALTKTAETTQKDLRAYLDSQGIAYKSFYIANKILVHASSQESVLAIAGRTDVDHISANHVFQLEEPRITPAGEVAPEAIESNLTFIHADAVWAMGVTGVGTVLAGNDTGLDWDHPALINHYRGWNGSSVDHNYNWWDATDTYRLVPNDGHGHGTHITGTMVGDDGATKQIGVAPGAKSIHCKNMTDFGSGDDATFSECFQWDLAPWNLSGANPDPAMAPDAINNSWGYFGGSQPQFKDEIDALQAAGILVEVSAGNEGSGCKTLRSPGDYADVLTTGSVKHRSVSFPGTLTGFSSRGPSDLYPNIRIPDVMAPGQNINSSLPGGGYSGPTWSGTSMAGPHVVGLVGLLWSANPALRGDIAGTVQIIKDTASPLTGQNGSNCGGDYTVGPNNDWGVGTIDALAAVLAAGQTGCTENCLRVSAITMRAPGAGVNARISVLDEDGTPVSNAVVSATWDLPGGGTSSQARPTNALGVANFKIAGGAGTYVITVTNVTLAGFTFDPDGSTEISDSITK
jgi:subtilisin family serine protease